MFHKIMKKGFQDFSPSISLTVLGTLCFFFTPKKCSITGLNLIWGYIILYAIRGVMMHFQSNPHDYLVCHTYLRIASRATLLNTLLVFYIPRLLPLQKTSFSLIKFFLTLVMCQTRFRISKEMSREIYPPVLRSKDCWFLYSIQNPDQFKCVLKAFIVLTSPVISLISTALLLLGKTESNPYFFIPWLFLTIKGLLLIQTDNLITIIRDMGNRENFVFGFRLEDFKWLIFYCSIFMIDLVEIFSFCEIFDLFLVLWNHHPGYNISSVNLEVVKKEITEIMEALSKCSMGNLSKISLESITDSEGTNESNIKKAPSISKFFFKEEDKACDRNAAVENLSKVDILTDSRLESELKRVLLTSSLKSKPENDFSSVPANEIESIMKDCSFDFNEFESLTSSKLQI